MPLEWVCVCVGGAQAQVLSWSLKGRNLCHHSQQDDKCTCRCQNASAGSVSMSHADKDTSAGVIAGETWFPHEIETTASLQLTWLCHNIQTSKGRNVNTLPVYMCWLLLQFELRITFEVIEIGLIATGVELNEVKKIWNQHEVWEHIVTPTAADGASTHLWRHHKAVQLVLCEKLFAVVLLGLTYKCVFKILQNHSE